MGKPCGHCGATASIEERGGLQVCCICGVVASESILDTQDTARDGQTYVAAPHDSYRQMLNAGALPRDCILRGDSAQRTPAWKTLSVNKITQLTTVLKLGADVKNLAFRYYEDLCMHGEQSIKHRNSAQKEIFCLACIYMACREYELPVTMDLITNTSEYNAHLCFAAVKEAVCILGICLKPHSVDSLVEAVLSQDLHSSVTVTEHAKSLTKQLLELMADLFLSQGRKPRALIMAVFYYVYKSEDFYKRRKLKWNQVVKNFKAVSKVKSLIKPALLELLKSIPWLSDEDQTEEMIPYYLKDIVRYKKVLIRDALRRTNGTDTGTASHAQPEEQNPSSPIKDSLDREGQDKNPITVNQSTSDSAVNTESSEKQNELNDSPRKRDNQGQGTTDTKACETTPEKGAKETEPQIKSNSDHTNTSPESEPPKENTLFHPPAYKRARRRSQEREIILDYIASGKEALEKLEQQLG